MPTAKFTKKEKTSALSRLPVVLLIALLIIAGLAAGLTALKFNFGSSTVTGTTTVSSSSTTNTYSSTTNPSDFSTTLTNSNQTTSSSSISTSTTAKSSNTSTSGYTFSEISVGSRPGDLIYDSVNNRIYVVNTGSNTISIIDPSSDNVVGTIQAGDNPIGISYNPSSNVLYVEIAGYVNVINATSNQNITKIAINGGARYGVMTFVSMNHFLYVALTGRVAIINTDTYSVSGYIVLPQTLHYGQALYTILGSAYDPSNNNLYLTVVGSYANASIFVIDTVTNKIIQSYPPNAVGNATPHVIVYSPNNGLLYVSTDTCGNCQSSYIFAINPNSSTVVANVSLPASEFVITNLALDPSHNQLYVAGNASIAIIDSSTEAVIQTISTNQQIGPIVYNPVNGYLYGIGSNNIVLVLRPSTTFETTMSNYSK